MTDLIDTSDIAEMVGLERGYVRDRITKLPDFPSPALKLSRKTVRWDRQDVVRWIEAQRIRACRRSS